MFCIFFKASSTEVIVLCAICCCNSKFSCLRIVTSDIKASTTALPPASDPI